MRELGIFAVVAAAVFAIGGMVYTYFNVDRGQCLASHTETVEGYYYTTYIQSGSVSVPIMNYSPPYDVEVCDRWEFPEGRPK